MSVAFDFIAHMREKPNGRTPFNDEIEIIKNIEYKYIDGNSIVLDLYLPSHKSAEKLPIVFDIPGGGWMVSNRARRDGYATLFATLGAAVVVIDHRLCPSIHFPEDLKDVIDAINFLPTLAEKYNLDLDNLCVTGDSSGGHLAACVGCAATNNLYRAKLSLKEIKVKPKMFIMVSGAYSFEVMYRLPFAHALIVKYLSGKKTRKAFRQWQYYKESDPYNYINKDFAPTYNSGGATDFLCLGEATRMSKHLDALGVENECTVGRNLFNSSHCYIMRLPFAPARHDMLTLLGWYVVEQKKIGIDMSDGYGRVGKFLNNYHSALKGKIKC
ncbi:MAG: alpha/beta hydrolase [Clostridia bacterium]